MCLVRDLRVDRLAALYNSFLPKRRRRHDGNGSPWRWLRLLAVRQRVRWNIRLRATRSLVDPIIRHASIDRTPRGASFQSGAASPANIQDIRPVEIRTRRLVCAPARRSFRKTAMPSVPNPRVLNPREGPSWDLTSWLAARARSMQRRQQELQ